MPVYVWNCGEHGNFDVAFKMADKPAMAPCPVCSKPCYSIPCFGGIQSDEPAWLTVDPGVLGSLQKEGERPIETRSEWKRYMKQNDIVCRS